MELSPHESWGARIMLEHNLNKVDPKNHILRSSTSFGSLHSLAEDEVFGWDGSSPFAQSPETTGFLHDGGFTSSPSQQPRIHRSSSRASGDSSPKILSDFIYEKPASSPPPVSLISRDCVDLGPLLFQDEFGKVYAATWIGVKTRVRIINLCDQGISASALCGKLSHPVRHPFIESHLGCIASSENPSTEVWAMTEGPPQQLTVRLRNTPQRAPRSDNALAISSPRNPARCILLSCAIAQTTALSSPF